MKTLVHIAAIAALALTVPAAFAQQTGSSKAATPPAAQATQIPTPEEFDKQIAKMQEQMKNMQEEMTKIQQTQDPQERQRLLQDHYKTMQSTMSMMQGTWGGMGMMGGPMMRDHMMGGHMGGMMGWGNYQNLTPEQLKQRQYMMDSWVPMQQMMMNHMMQHQGWMMPSAPPAAPAK